MPEKNLILTLFLWMMPFLLMGQVVNIESKRFITDTTGWAGGISVNSAWMQNKQRLFSFGSKAHVQWKPTRPNLFLILGEYGFTKGNQSVFQDFGFGHFRYTKRLNDRFAVESFAQAQYNKANRLRFRGLLGAGPRYELISQKELKVFVAALAMLERNISVDNHFFEGGRLSAYVSFTYQPSKSFKLINTTYYQPRFNLWSDFRISGETRLEWGIYQRLKWITTYYYSYDAFPPEGVPLQGYRLNNGLKFSF
ncbi:MAG TPA: DUF481 domain-containing protein [Saprospiraceae bacterium]|nr:DUF481 domain-containing protein [Saprospiraceae bacterium]